MTHNYKTAKGSAAVFASLKPCPSMTQKSSSNISWGFVHDELLLFLENCTTLFINGYVMYARNLTGCSAGHLFNDHFWSLCLQF